MLIWLDNREPGIETGAHDGRSGRLASLSTVARFIAELANLPLRGDQPFVGHSAFAHKGGVHVSAVLKDFATYEHVHAGGYRKPAACAGQRSFRPRQCVVQAQAAWSGRIG